MDRTKRKMRKRQCQQSKETTKLETEETHRNGKGNVEQDNKAHCSKKSKLAMIEGSRTLRNRVVKGCHSDEKLDAKDLNSTNLKATSDQGENNNWKCDEHSNKPDTENQFKNQSSAGDKDVSERFNCMDCKMSDGILTEKQGSNSSIPLDDLSASAKTVRRIMQPINCVKTVCHGKRHSLESSPTTDGKNSINVSRSGNLVHQLPSKYDMCAEFTKPLVENKFGLVSRQPVSNASPQRRDSLLHLLMDNSFGVRGRVRGNKVILKAMSDQISDFHLVRTGSPFDRRCTAMAWHPFNPNLVVVGSKGGDICLMDLENSNRDVFIQGCGLGGVIQAMKFVPETTTSLRLLTASMDGTVTLRDLALKSTLTTFVNTSHLIHQFWYCSCDVGPQCNMVVHGDSLGNATLQTMNGEKIWSHKLHKNKINHTEFHRKQEWLLCTASTDQYVCLWDIRMLKNADGYLTRLKHEKGVNSAYFSQTDGTRLLTTDQHHELRIYECGSWNLEQTIVHPHRFYQHLTPMKAAWHPLEDMIVCGRYPDKSLPGFASDNERGIDLIDPSTTENICRLYDPVANGIVTIAQFNNMGSTLAATMGYTILIWQKDDTQEEENKGKAKDRPYGFKPPDDATSRGPNSDPKSRFKTKLRKNTNTKQ